LKPLSCLLFQITCFLFLFFSLASAYPVPDTGQTRCYDDAGDEISCDGSGQDGSFSVNPMSYTKLDKNGAVLLNDATEWSAARDNVTGLVWEVKNKDNKTFTYKWGDAPEGSTDLYVNNHLKMLNDKASAGKKNWRLPTISELIMLGSNIDIHSTIKCNPAIFPNTQDIDAQFDPYAGTYWSSSPKENNTLATLTFGFFLVSAGSKTTNKRNPFLRAVSGSQQIGESRFKYNNDTVTDTETGLMWELEPSDKYNDETYTWDQAIEYCKSLELGEYNDWRMPSAKELISITNVARIGNITYPKAFPHMQVKNRYWTSTYIKAKGDYFSFNSPLIMDFSRGNYLHGSMSLQDATESAKCVIAVRGGQPVIDGHLVITSPAQGESLEAGSTKRIIWDNGDQETQGDVSILLSDDGGKSYGFITESAANGGEYQWDIPAELDSVNCVLKLTPLAQDQAHKGTTQGLFKIGKLLGIKVEEPNGHTREDGTPATFLVYLKTQPAGEVVLSIESDNPLEGIIIEGDTLSFVPGDYDQPQLVTFSGVDDDVADGSVTYHAIITVDTKSTTDTTGYSELKPAQVSLVNADNDTAAFVVSPMSNDISESGTTGTFTVRITSRPTLPVTIKFYNPYPDECGLTPESLTFLQSTWTATQTVTVTGLKDNIPDGDRTYDIHVRVDKEKTLDKSGYADLKLKKLTVTNINIDPGIRLTDHIVGFPYCHKISEDGLTSSFSVKLILPPDDDVIVDITCTDTSEGTVSPQKLTFTPENWATDQLVTITGVDDAEIDGQQEFEIKVTVNASETKDKTGYKKVIPRIIEPVRNADDDDWERIGFSVSNITGEVTENGGSATFNVALNTVPNDDVIVSISSKNEAEVTVSPAALVFTPENWNIHQTVTVTGVQDNKDDGEKEVTIHVVVNAATSDTTGYKNTSPTDVTFKSKDASSAGEADPTAEADGESSEEDGCFIQSIY